MAKTNFLAQLEEATKVVSKATKFIETAPLKTGQTIKLLKKGQDINEAPMVSRVDKHNCYDEFGVVALSKPDKEILIHLVGKGEVSDEKKVFPVTELNSFYMLDEYNTCLLADMISEILK